MQYRRRSMRNLYSTSYYPNHFLFLHVQHPLPLAAPLPHHSFCSLIADFENINMTCVMCMRVRGAICGASIAHISSPPSCPAPTPTLLHGEQYTYIHMHEHVWIWVNRKFLQFNHYCDRCRRISLCAQCGWQRRARSARVSAGCVCVYVQNCRPFILVVTH